MGLRETIAGVFSFLGTRTQGESRIASYIIREHRLGRSVAAILTDPYVTNRCSPKQIDRLLDRPELLHALGQRTVTEAQAERAQADEAQADEAQSDKAQPGSAQAS